MLPDYSGHNLRGRSFIGQNLTGANFSRADIRGVNFTNANLKNADFRGAKAGLQLRWVTKLLIVSWLILGLLGFLSIIIAALVAYIFDTTKLENIVTGIVSLVAMAVFYIVTVRRGLTAGLGAFAFALAIAGGMAIAIAFTRAFSIALAVAGAIAVTGAFAGVFAIAVAGAVAGSVVVNGAFDGSVASCVAGAIAVAITVAGSVAGFFAVKIAVVGAVAVAIAFVLLSSFISCRSLAGDQKYAWVRSAAITFAATGGTSFRGADLTDADFTGAILKNTDFRTANLTRTRVYETKKLDFAIVDDSILANRSVLNLLVSGNGRGKSYLNADLKGANLIGADLKQANLKHADISEATFQGACLEWANLTRIEAVGTDFTSAQMTGACIEAWNIESTTNLDNIDCRFIYLLENPKPGTDDHERRPHSGEFKAGEFTKLFQEVVHTVDLIFRNGIDWKAFVTAFKKVQVENEDTELSIQSIENKGDGVVVVKVNVPHDADKEKIHSDFTQNYQLALQAVEERYKAQLEAKNEQIVIYRQQNAEIKEIVGLLANKPINVQVENKVENKNMTNSNDTSRKIEIGSVGRDLNASGQALNLGEIDISGVVTNTINELPASSEPFKPGIKELLTQLQTAIEAEKNLTPKNKEKALKQVKVLAEASQNSQDADNQDLADTAITMLKGVIASLPSAAKLVEECSKILPLISVFLGLG